MTLVPDRDDWAHFLDQLDDPVAGVLAVALVVPLAVAVLYLGGEA
jgi:hypothetical protein